MAYAQTRDVLARAGSLKPAFADGQPVSPAEITVFLEQTAGEIDAFVGARGFGVPVTDLTAVAALASVNTDMALLLAIDANWPGSSARDDVADLRASIQGRVDGYLAGLAGGGLAALLYLGAQAAAAAQGGASDFWTTDGLTYEWWSRFVRSRWGAWGDPWGAPSFEASAPFSKGMPL